MAVDRCFEDRGSPVCGSGLVDARPPVQQSPYRLNVTLTNSKHEGAEASLHADHRCKTGVGLVPAADIGGVRGHHTCGGRRPALYLLGCLDRSLDLTRGRTPGQRVP